MPTDKDKIDGMTLLPSESYSDPPSEDDPALKGPESMKLPCVSLIGQLALDLRASFIWRDTPPGLDYWFQVFSNLVSIAEAQPLDTARIPSKQPKELASELANLFIWSETLQGYDYWNEVLENLCKIGDE